MPRKPLLYTDEAPYHITARSNNQDWFYLPARDCWHLFRRGLNHIHNEFGFEIHAFVLMSNHYHLIGQCSKEHDLGEVMGWLQKFISKQINRRTGRINHVFGGPYKASLILHPYHYRNVYKYVARNPVKAGLSSIVEDYSYSTFSRKNEKGDFILVTTPLHWLDSVPRCRSEKSHWLNQNFEERHYDVLREGLKRTIFKAQDRSTRTDPFITQVHNHK
ncbi:transposase [Bdellovibrio bacteriovorus]|uniref:transposase n=1 Tax=Bdellovibrio bacteriovorus TaxID=959 RepID=UPI0039775303